jgi:hypothetical protein
MHLGTADTKNLKWRKVRDGVEVLTIPMVMMDGAPREMAEAANSAIAETSLGVIDTSANQPHFAPQTDADRERRQQLYADADERLTSRWKSPSPLAADVVKPAAPKPTGDVQQDAYDRYDQRISERWRGAA